MELLIRVHARGGTHDLRLEVDPQLTVAGLAGVVAEVVGAQAVPPPALALERTGVLLDPEDTVEEAGILSGDELLLAPESVPRPKVVPVRAVSVDVLAGPESGRSVVLGPGHHTLGRDADCDVVLADRTVSRHHLDVTVSDDWSVTVHPREGTENGLLVNHEPVFAFRAVTRDDVLTIGATRIALREFTRAADEAVDRLGQVQFHRTPYRPAVVQERKLEPLGPIPSKPTKRRFQTLAILAPVVLGIAMVAITHQVQFLLFMFLSPITMVGTWYEDRRTGRRDQVEAVAEFHERTEEARQRLDEALAAERTERVRAAPDLADLARRAELRTVDLWPRSRRVEDFLVLRLGLGDAESRITAAVQGSGGDDDLRVEAEAALAHQRDMPEVPVTVDLAGIGTMGVHGREDVIDATSASIVLQAACLHSPEDLIVAAAVRPERAVAEWLKWLPHTRSVTSPIGGRHLTTDANGARRLLNELVQVADLRLADQSQRVDRRWPWVLLVLDGDLDPDPTLVSQLLDRCPWAGISVLWLSASAARVPRQAAAVVDGSSPDELDRVKVWFTDPELPDQFVEVGSVDPGVASRVARRLAPVRDASVATATTAIPRVVPLLSALGVDRPDADWVLARWRTERGYGLWFPVGMGPDGVFAIDLVADGPHGLIGGTSGAGKSELLQAIVASAITVHPPSRLNFLFVDYKGGASSTVFRDVPHTVGYVTNLDADLSMRALTSLRAELNRRMRLMEGRAKDLEEMLARHPDEAPPSLVIVVDEFATLVKEIPDFVAGIVDIAQRGRSLGIHLILATQRPSGSVNDNILANTNLRMSLRMLDNAESTSVIGAPVAADIPVPLRGRGFARLGPSELVPFQSAYCSAPLEGDAGGEHAVTVSAFELEPTAATTVVAGGARHAVVAEQEARTQLDAVLDAVVAAARSGGHGRSRAPWQEMLPDHLRLDDVLADDRVTVPREHAGRLVVLGTVDDPEHQDQYPAVVDLEESGGLLVFGSGGSGKTTLLRTIAAGAARQAPPEDLVVFGIDFASRSLRSIAPLPHVSAVATGDDLDGVTRIIALLEAELERRRGILAAHQAETLTTYQAQGGGPHLPRVLLLVDGYVNLVSAFSTGGSFGNTLDAWLDRLHGVVLDGRQVGIHAVLAAERRNGVPVLVQSSIGGKLILRQADANGYADLGIPMSRAATLDLPPGRGLWTGGRLLQIACVSADGEGQAQAEALATQAQGLGGAPAITVGPLPERVHLRDLDPVDPPRVPLGMADLSLATVGVDVEHSNLLIAGLPRSGRSTAALVVASGLERLGHEVWKVGPGSSPLAKGADLLKAGFGRADALQPVLEELADLLESTPTNRPRVLVADDLDSLEDPMLGMVWDRLTAAEHLRVVATIENRSFSGFSMNNLLNDVRKARRILVLQPDDAMELFQMTGVKAPLRPGVPMPPGRGVLFVDRRPTVLQGALPNDD
jgi:S-DNA-T family DNA segregation ATPase FtsK/SpoIIIE